MSYLKEIQNQIKKRDFSKFILLWEEYCSDDQVDPEEYAEILKVIKASDFALPFGKYVELGLPLWEMIKDKKHSYKVLSLIVDLQTNNNESLSEKATQLLEEAHSTEPEFNERMRLVGLKPLGDYQGAMSNYDLLAHMAIGKCVFHTGGWGTGEIVDLSPIREQLAVEFEYLSGRKYITFKNAFKCLIPLQDDHILARRFVDPDKLEKEAKKDAVATIKDLLRDLGPLTAAEIKDELCELVIPDKDWTKWWQNARVKLKKDTMVEMPNSLKEPFVLRKQEVTHEEQLQKDMKVFSDVASVIQTTYNYVRDFPNMLKNDEVKNSIKDKLAALLKNEEISLYHELQIYIFFENLLGIHADDGRTVKEIIVLSKDVEELVNRIEIIAFKKRALVAIREYREDWINCFLSLALKISQSQLREYIFKELNSPEAKEHLLGLLEDLLSHPIRSPEALVWYFQKILSDPKQEFPYSDKKGINRVSESYLVLLHQIENHIEFKELAKKMHQFLINKRYEVVRILFDGADINYIKEFLLLASKCQLFTGHDHKILHSLAGVVHSELGPIRRTEDRLRLDGRTIWTSEAGYHFVKNKAQKIGTVEIVENAREVEAARALGDLRENSEYKFAVERRRHLQNELKRLSDELNRARIITHQDISLEEIGIGNVIELLVDDSISLKYTILGPWDANAEENILSFQSKLAQEMIGKKVNDKFTFRDQEYKIVSIKSYLDK